MQVVRADGFDRLEPIERALALPAEAQPVPGPVEYPLVMVEWHDAWFDFDLAGPDEARQDYVVRTVGFLVGDGPRFVSIAQEVLPDGEGFRAVSHIPLPIIERLVHLAPGGGLVTA